MAFPVAIKTLPTRPALTLAHIGPYTDIGRTFGQLDLILRSEGLLPCVRGMFGLYVDDPDTVPPEQLRSRACVFVESTDARSPKLESLTVGGGAYAVLTYKGPYAAMKPAYDWLFGTWLPQVGREPRDAPVMEINLNTPMDTAPQDLLTEICLPLET